MLRSLLSVLALLAALPVSAASFPDTADSPFDAEIGALKDSGTVSGYADGTFRPNQTLNRAEFVKMLLLEEGYAPYEPSRCFGDFGDEPLWFYGYACAAREYGYVQGYPDGTFGGERTINLVEALKILMTARNIQLPQYFQAPDPWYDPYLVAGDGLGLFSALPRDPAHEVTRGEMAYLLAHVTQPRPPKPEGTWESSFLLHETFYDCAHPIEGEWREANVGQLGSPGWYFYPKDEVEFEKFCRAGAVIEYRAVIDILGREDVAEAIEKNDTIHAWVRALGHVYIDDKDYLKRILPAYDSAIIDCIIVVHTPEETRFFLENAAAHESHDDHRYIEVPAAEFLESLYAASDEDVTAFWLGLH